VVGRGGEIGWVRVRGGRREEAGRARGVLVACSFTFSLSSLFLLSLSLSLSLSLPPSLPPSLREGRREGGREWFFEGVPPSATKIKIKIPTERRRSQQREIE